jgi:hypothetical protein
MAEAQELHQIEYQRHPTRDLHPVASSLAAEALRAWNSRIQGWVRHPRAERLFESMCYQVFPNGQAALAVRRRDPEAAGTRDRSQVSRVLLGPAAVLTAPLAITLCRRGLPADAIGSAPGDVADGARLPTVNAEALRAVAPDLAAHLDQDAVRSPGLQALVAAALADPSVPLAVHLPPDIIDRPLRDGVQAPLLWGLIRIAGPLLSRVGRGWSFSTYELPMGETDPATLPGIVFRQVQEGQPVPPVRHRKELRVRPYDAEALLPGSRYAAQVELAGWLVAEYAARGGAGLRKFIEGCARTESTFQMRLERVGEELAKSHAPPVDPSDATWFVPLSPERVAGPADRDEAGRPAEPVPADPGPAPPAPAGPSLAAEPLTRAAGPPQPEHAQPEHAQPEHAQPEHAQPEPTRPDLQVLQPPAWMNNRAMRLAATREGRAPQLPVTDRNVPQQGPYDEPAAPSGAGQPTDPVAPNSGQHNRGRLTVSHLLTELEMAGQDRERAESCLRAIRQLRGLDDPDERRASWRIISDVDWCERVYDSFQPADLAAIFKLVAIPDIAEEGWAEPIGQWSLRAPMPMIGGLLIAASEVSDDRKVNEDTWRSVMRLLEPFLALRLVTASGITSQWDADLAWQAAKDFKPPEPKSNIWNSLNPLRRRQ